MIRYTLPDASAGIFGTVEAVLPEEGEAMRWLLLCVLFAGLGCGNTGFKFEPEIPIVIPSPPKNPCPPDKPCPCPPRKPHSNG